MKKKKKENPIDFGSYSDLFMVMSFVFLFMYVISSLNTGIQVIQERQRADLERKNLKSTVAKYERKIETELNDDQKKEYDKLTAGLIKLKEDAREAREYQEKMADMAREKEKELDVYQETIKTMMVDQLKVAERIKEKDDIINKVKEETTAVIQNQVRSIASLREEVDHKTQVLEQKSVEVEKRAIEIKKIERRVEELKHKEVLAESQSKELQQLTLSLNQKESELELAKVSEANLQKEKDKLYKASLVQVNRMNREKEKIAQSSQAELDRLQQEKQQLAKETSQELARLEAEKHSVAASKEAEKTALIKAKQAELNDLMKSKDAEKAALIASKESELKNMKAQKDAELKGLQAKYHKATTGLRKEIADSLAAKLRDSGLMASVNASTGDVTVHFKNAYYDYNSSVLKDPMKDELKIFIPLYAKSLFENKKYASSISSVEIIGSSSPSFKGKYVNPRAMASVDEKKAMTYNLDLSYRRAKSIFDFTFLSNDFAFAHKDEMIPLIKVSGTGYLQAMDELVILPESTQKKDKGFCGLYNCEVFQKVTLRFNLKDRVTQK